MTVACNDLIKSVVTLGNKRNKVKYTKQQKGDAKIHERRVLHDNFLNYTYQKLGS